MIYFTNEQLNEILKFYEEGKTLKEISEFYNVSRPTISKVLRQKYPAYTGKKKAKKACENQTKICSKCKQELPLDAFNKGNSLYGRRSFCRECEHKLQNTQDKVARRRELELKRRENPEYVKHRNQKDIERRMSNKDSYRKYLLNTAKHRAKKKHLDFNITLEDIVLPKICPLLEIPLTMSKGKASENSYSLDRIDSSKGYIKGNVWVISNRANLLKNNATLEELELLVNNIRNKLNK